MKKWLLVLAGLCVWAPVSAAPADEPEIVIEMHGEPTPAAQAVSILDKNARQLTRIFRGKDRTFVLYHVSNVSSKDDILRTPKGTEYAYVRYGSDDGDYRKFLFKAEDPQTFVACAANLEDVLAVNQKYQVNLGVHLKDFLRRYEEESTLTNLQDEKNGKTYQAYRINYADVNHKKPSPYYFVFEKEQLINTYAGDEAFYAFVGNLSDANKKIAQEKKEAEAARQKQAEQARQKALQKANRPVRKALVDGGTANDQAYMPRVVNPKPLPPLTPSKIPAGTHLD